MMKCNKCEKIIIGGCYNAPGGPFCPTCYEEIKQEAYLVARKVLQSKAIDFLRDKNLWDWIEARGGMQVGKQELIDLLVEFRVNRRPFEY